LTLKRNRNESSRNRNLDNQSELGLPMEFAGYRIAFENTADLIFVIDDKYRILLVNRAAGKLLGKTPSEIQGKAVFDVFRKFPEEASKQFAEDLQKVFRTGKGLLDHDSRIVVEGKELWISTRLDPITNGNGDTSFVLGVSRFVTERKKMEEALWESDDRYRALFDRSSELIYVHDFEGRFLDANDAALKTLGYSRSEIRNLTLESLLSNDQLPKAKRRIEELLRAGQSVADEFRLRTKKNELITVETKAAVIHHAGKPFAVLGIARNITERKKTEEALRESEERSRVILENSPSMIGIIQDGILKYVNGIATLNLGWNFEELLSPTMDPIGKIVSEKSRSLLKENIARRLRGERIAPYEINLTKKDGSEISVVVRAAKIIFEGRPAIEFVFHDITDRKRIEEKLRSLHQHALKLASATRTEEIAEYTLETMQFTLGFNHADFNLIKDGMIVTKASRGEMANYSVPVAGRGVVSKAAREKKSIRVDDTRMEPDYLDRKAVDWNGPPTMLSELATPVIIGDQTVAILNVEHAQPNAFTEQDQTLLENLASHVASEMQRLEHQVQLENYSKHLEVLVEERTRKLRQAERLAAVGETAAMVGHDLRNPLQGITGAVHLLKDKSLTAEERSEMLQLIQESVEYSDGIVRDLLEYSTEIELKLAETTPKSIIAEALRAVRAPDEITVQDLSEEHPRIRVDRDRMRRVLVNLFENAIDAMSLGGTLTIGSKQSEGDVEIIVSDNGSGMPESVMKNLWKPLQTTKSKGMGLGLAICKRIVDAHGGTIIVKSKAGEGTTVTLQLPTQLGTLEVKQK
jgi:PAS domain S-box-containing protein